ncbi:MAG: hypothetical protein KDA84_02010 [Planctomycetaceae bacterium]|nr:hypothetical protein [Planctomycetaceae bacterium]
MSKIFHPLLIMLAGCSEKELGRQVQYLKDENRILRAKFPKRHAADIRPTVDR